MRYALMALALLLAGWLLTGVTVVRPGERALVRRFGRVLDDKPAPGLHVGFPWGIDRVARVAVESDRRVTVGYRAMDAGEHSPLPPAGQFLTGDHNLVNVLVVISYNVHDDGIEDYVTQADRVDGLLVRAAETVLNEWVAGRKVDHILARGKAELPGWMKEQLQRRIAPYRLGIEIKRVSVQELLPPEKVRPDFEEVTRAEQNKGLRIVRARTSAKHTVQQARTERTTIDRATDARVAEQLKLAEADARRFEERLQKNQHLLRDNRKLLLNNIWWSEMTELFARLKEKGQLHLLDHNLTKDGLDMTTIVPPLKKATPAPKTAEPGGKEP